MSQESPQHLHLTSSRLGWDWRRENPVEVVIVVFFLVFFFLIPRGGCGVTQKGARHTASFGASSAAFAPTHGHAKKKAGKKAAKPAKKAVKMAPGARVKFDAKRGLMRSRAVARNLRPTIKLGKKARVPFRATSRDGKIVTVKPHLAKR